MIGIVDYGIGNVGSIRNMLKKIGTPAEVAVSPDAVFRADKLILPGVGAFDAGMRRLRESGLLPALQHQATAEKVPVLGICLGMQLMTRDSEEGNSAGLGWIDATTVRFHAHVLARLRVPHMGWNRVTVAREHPLTAGIDADTAFYFVHSYHVVCANPDDALLASNYGCDFVAAFAHNNLYGVQFHPEKSHKHGIQVFKNFAEL